MTQLSNWIPAGVYPGGNRGRNDADLKLAFMPSKAEVDTSWNRGDGGNDTEIS